MHATRVQGKSAMGSWPGESLRLQRDQRGTHLPVRGPAKSSGADAEGEQSGCCGWR